MIQSKEDLKKWLKQDLSNFSDSPVGFRDFVLGNERWYVYHYIKQLRYVEYCINCHKGGIIHRVRLYWHYFLFKRLGHIMNIIIFPNTVEPGLTLYHFGDFTHVAKTCHIGKNCTILPGVVFGKKTKDENRSVVGDNCYFGLGVKILGTVHIGNNVTVGANAVVTKDIPDNCVVAGVPGKIIKRQEAIE